MSKILVVNFGSSSLKYGVFNGFQEVLMGNIDIKTKQHKINKMMVKKAIKGITPALILETVIDALKVNGNVFPGDITAVVHRVVHGGIKFVQPTTLSNDVLVELEKLNDLAPLHNPVNIAGIRAAMKVLPNAKHVAVFDTAFHATIPEYASTYGIPHSYTQKGVRRYGFHGSSHEYIIGKAAEYLRKPVEELNGITVHAGNGTSICCIRKGSSVDISMGMTPYAGVIMGTRPGDLDPGIIVHLMKTHKLSIEAIEKILNTGCGLKGISGISSDYRKIEEEAIAGNKRCQLALDVLYYQVKKYIGAYLAVLEYNIDAIVFTGGIGENSANFRSAVLRGFSKIGIIILPEKNKLASGKDFSSINMNFGSIPLLVIKTNEELMMIKKAMEIL